MVGLSLAAAAGSTVVLIMQVLQIPRGKRERTFLFPDQRAQRDRDAQAKQEADWLHMLSAFVPVWTSLDLFFPFLPSREKIFL